MDKTFDSDFDQLWNKPQSDTNYEPHYPLQHWYETQAPSPERIDGITTEVARLAGMDAANVDTRSQLRDIVVLALFLGSQK